MPRYAMAVSYLGTAYHGWQSQKTCISIQTVLEAALSKVANHMVSIICGGRTDKGVHALGQVVHFDSSALRSINNWFLGVNTYLPNDINVLWIVEVGNEFNARFSATKRKYLYLVDNHQLPCMLLKDRALWLSDPLNLEVMNDAVKYLIGEHDFSAFRASGCQSLTPIRHVYEFEVRRKNNIIFISITANAFLYHMVRNIVGSLLLVGKAMKPPEWFEYLLLNKDRQKAGSMAAAHGLYLYNIEYGDFAVPETEALKIFGDCDVSR